MLTLAACAPPHDRAPADRPAPESASAPAAAPTRQAPAAAPVRPAELVGLDSRALDRLLGPPELVRREGGAEIRLYRGTACTLHLFLYPRDGMPRATYLEARSRAGRLSAGEEARCLHAIAGGPG